MLSDLPNTASKSVWTYVTYHTKTSTTYQAGGSALYPELCDAARERHKPSKQDIWRVSLMKALTEGKGEYWRAIPFN